MAVAIQAENLSKAYQLGEMGTGTLSRDLERWIAKIRGKEDPFLKIGETNDRTAKGGSDVVWSLKDINFQIEQGDAVGIIGRNGAGKSTLLKLLSRVTSPTTGNIKVKGRIASLLEVGTGFHPELTGKENIFLNGAILGMRKKEIARKFDEIVDFAGVERYVDTPVKRYSSGMYVRLAFAVAAYLESEILIVDEVLAVGDIEFQNKCLGKMGDVSKREGRTILFVSHNMSSVQSLCNKGMILKNGELNFRGDAIDAVAEYMRLGTGHKGFSQDTSVPPFGKRLKIRKIVVLSNNEICIEVNNRQEVFIEIEFEVLIEGRYNVKVELSHIQYGTVFTTSFLDCAKEGLLKEGTCTYRFKLPSQYLRGGDYIVNAIGDITNTEQIDAFKYETQFHLIDLLSPVAKINENRTGVIVPTLEWIKMH